MIQSTLAQIDLLRVVFAAVAGVVVGAVWYLPGVFGRTWKEALGGGPQRRLGNPRVVVVVRSLATAFTALALAIMIVGSGASTLAGALRLGLAVSVGVVVPTIISDYLFAGSPPRLVLITAGHRVVHIMVMCAVLGAD